jgi:dolichol kinase
MLDLKLPRHGVVKKEGKCLEGLRKLIHISGIFTIVLAEILGTPFLSSIILCITVLYLISEYFRLHGRSLPIVTKITGLAARGEESSGWILRPVSFAAGILIAMNLFPKPINYAAISVLTLADGLVSLVGTRFGHHHLPYNKKKTIEGSTFFFIASLLSTLIFVNPVAALLGSIVGTATESIFVEYTENLMIPITVGFSMSILLLLSC